MKKKTTADDNDGRMMSEVRKRERIADLIDF